MLEEQRRLVAIMFTDMVGYSSLTQKNEKIALELLEEHRRILRPIFSEFNGKEIKTIGDAFLVCFDNTLDAVRCAIKIQATLYEYNLASPETIQIKVRIGIHLGDVVMRGGDLYGDGVNIASRIQSVADSNGITISEDVYRQVQNKVEAKFTRLGKGELKNIAIGMGIYKVSPLPTSWIQDISERAMFFLQQKRARNIALSTLLALGAMWLVFALIPQPTPEQTIQARIEKIKSEKKRPRLNVVVADFANETSDKRFIRLHDRITKLFIATLEQSDTFTVMSRSEMRAALRQLKREKEKHITESLAREICHATNTPVFVVGSVKKFGRTFTVDVKAFDAKDSAPMITVVEEAKAMDSIPSTVGRLVSAIRKELELQALEILQQTARADSIQATERGVRTLRSE